MRRLLNIVVVVVCVSLGSASGAVAAAPSGCENPAQSALNQYCDSIPTADGARPPAPGTPALASSLPPRLLGRLGTSGAQRVAHQRLLSLPAPVRAPRRMSSDASGGASIWSLAMWMIVVLLAIAVGMTAVAAARRRRERPRLA